MKALGLVLLMAVAAHAAGNFDECGVIMPGVESDCLILRTDSSGDYTLLGEILYADGGQHIRVFGNVLAAARMSPCMQEGRHVKVDSVTLCEWCCNGLAGNIDGDPDDVCDIGDLTRLIDFLYISRQAPQCMAEANVDGRDGVDIGDLTRLIDVLYISRNSPAGCP